MAKALVTSNGNRLIQHDGLTWFASKDGRALRLGGQHDWNYLKVRGAEEVVVNVAIPEFPKLENLEYAEILLPGHEVARTVGISKGKSYFLGYTDSEVARGIKAHGSPLMFKIDPNKVLEIVLAERKSR